jgi:hypothetical protein
MASKKSGLDQFVNQDDRNGTPTKAQATRGQGKRVGIAVRLSQEDWYRASEFALREHTSLQKLLVAGLSELMRQRGLEPLKGE